MTLFRVDAFLVMCVIVLSAAGKCAAQNSATKQVAKSDDIPKSIAESVSGTLQFAEGNFIGLAEAMPEDKYSYIPQSASSTFRSLFRRAVEDGHREYLLTP